MDQRPSAEDLKRDINNLVWMICPPDTTLAQAELIACSMHNLISTEWNRWEKNGRCDGIEDRS